MNGLKFTNANSVPPVTIAATEHPVTRELSSYYVAN